MSSKPFAQEQPNAKHVVIIGGGFAGVNCALKLAPHPNVRISLIERNNFQQFQPLLYQVAAGMLTPSNDAFVLRDLFKHHANAEVKLGEVVSVDLQTRTATTAAGQSYQGDYLVLAAGSRVNYFGTPGADQHAYPLYSLQEAEVLRSRILAVLESAARDPALIAKGALNFVVVGGGPTGVEMAGTLGDMMHSLLASEYKDLDLSKAQIFLVDRADHVLEMFTEKSQAYAARTLEQRGVKLRLGITAQEVTAEEVLLSDGSRIPTRTVIWAGGLKAASLSGHLGLRPGHGGRLDVEPDFSVKGYAGAYALGDFANIKGQDGKALPQLAAVAEQSGKHCAENITAAIEGRPGKAFHYFDKGILAMIGRNAAVSELGKHRHELHGPLAFAAWLGVHLALLTTLRAKMGTSLEWLWDYVGRVQGDWLLDRPEQMNIGWRDAEKRQAA